MSTSAQTLNTQCPHCREALSIPLGEYLERNGWKCPGCLQEFALQLTPTGVSEPSPPVSQNENSDSVVYQETPTGSASPTPSASSGGGTSSPWLVYKLVFWGLQIGLPIGLFLIAGLTEMFFLSFFAILLLIPRLCLCRSLTNLVAPLFVQSVRCPGCQFEMEAVNRWTVGNYTDHKERHIFRARNPMDGTIVGHINCPQCDSTIRVR